MRVLETDWWSLLLPPEWEAEQDEESVLIGDRDGVGCIEITALSSESGAFHAADAERIAREDLGGDSWQSVRLGQHFAGVMNEGEEEGSHIREWCVTAGPVLLLVTYSCDIPNAGMDDAAVDEILATLVPNTDAVSAVS
jgi:hypothetical protein